jgi:mRNA interferase MazF
MNLTLQEQLNAIKTEMFTKNKEVEHKEDKVRKIFEENKLNINTVHSKINRNVAVDKINNVSKIICKRGEIFYSNLSGNLGSEQGGTRPVLIIQNDIGNKYSPTVIVAVLTSQLDKAKLPTHIAVDAEKLGLPKNSIVLFEQLRTLDKRRLREKICTLDEFTMKKVDKALKISVGISLDISKPKTLLEKLENETRNYVINKIKLIEGCKKSLELVYIMNGNQDSIDLFEDRIFEEENSLQYYCDIKNINYNEIYNDYLELERIKEESIAL